MSNAVRDRDRHMKAVQRALEYTAIKPMLWALEKARKPQRLTAWEVQRYRRWLFWKYGGAECAYCGRVNPLDCLTIDHIQPISKGGPVRDISNMVLSCIACNRAKGNKWFTLQEGELWAL